MKQEQSFTMTNTPPHHFYNVIPGFYKLNKTSNNGSPPFVYRKNNNSGIVNRDHFNLAEDANQVQVLRT